MDAIVMQAMAKWPNVPHCYGWLALDARGNWRMRDEHAQAGKLPGDRINNEALLTFIHRNYACDERGCWYFQNGPQRVYVTLEITPFIARTDPVHGFILHTGAPVSTIDSAWMTRDGELVLVQAGIPAAVDNRDIAQCLPLLRLGGTAASDDAVTSWLAGTDEERPDTMTLQLRNIAVPVRRIGRDALAAQFGFVTEPRPNH